MSYCGMSNVGGGNGGSEGEKSTSTSTSRKGKKNGGSDKPKQPQRGLGVAQLEQIRLRTQLGSNFPLPNSLIHHREYTHAHHAILPEEMRMQGIPYGVAHSSTSYPPYSPSSLPSTSSPYGHHHPNFMMFLGDERANLKYQDSQTNATRWNHHNNNGLQDSSSYHGQGGMASNNRNLFNHYEESRQRTDLLRSRGSINQNSDSGDDHEEVDLELRLSI